MKTRIYLVVMTVAFMCVPFTAHAAFFGVDSLFGSDSFGASIWRRLFPVAEKEDTRQIVYSSGGIMVQQGVASTCPKLSTVPPYIRARVDTLIADRVGADFFNQYITFTCAYSAHGAYTLLYALNASADPLVKKVITITVNKRGSLLNTIDLPECGQSYQACAMRVSVRDAISMASEAGLDKGSKSTTVRISDANEYSQGFAWVIMGSFDNGDGSSSLSTVSVDTVTGQISTSSLPS